MIAFRGVAKTYRPLLPFGRAVRAVDGITLDLVPGQVTGIAGPNGAGKSTLISLLLGFLRPSGGDVTIEGVSPRRWVERHGVAYLPELVNIPPHWSVDSTLRRYATLGGMAPPGIRRAVDAAIQQLGLEEHRRKSVKTLSKGTLQRLGIAQAMMQEDARLCVLDEPTHGLDPVWTLRFRDIIAGMRRGDRVILLASHGLDELERVCDRVAIIDRGQIQRVVDTSGLEARQASTSYRLALATGDECVPAIFPHSRTTGAGEFLIEVESLAALNAGLAQLLSRGAQVAAVAPARSALEQEFREAVGEAETAP